MLIFIDSADLSEIRRAVDMGLADGVTTNPSLMAKAGVRNPNEHYKAICDLVQGPVSAEVVSVTCDEMVAEGRSLAALHPNIVVKIPMLAEGLKAIKILSQEGIRINTTLIFSPLQALMAAKVGATYVSPFVGRLDDLQIDGMELIQSIRQILDNYAYDCQILSASLRHPMHVLRAAEVGTDVVTLPFAVVESLIKHPLTDIGLAKFLADHASHQQALGK